MNILIFDTETTSLTKPFCYNIGYIIYDLINHNIIVRKDYVIEQIWHNLPLFSTAYYSEKRPIYVNRMKGKKVKMEKYGYICQELARFIKKYDVELAFAYNSNFDEKVFNFNCDWFKCINPLDTIEIKDIRSFVHNFIVGIEYKKFCEDNKLFTDSGNYSTTAENVYKYITQNTCFEEEHTALSDSIIENEILLYCLKKGADINGNYPVLRSIERKQNKTLTVIGKDKRYVFDCNGYTFYKSKDTIKLK